MKILFSLFLTVLSVSVFSQSSQPAKPTSREFAAVKSGAAKGKAEDMCRLGQYYYYGLGTTKNLVTAKRWVDKSAAKGNVEAMLLLSDMYNSGVGAKKDNVKALEWMKKAALKGSEITAYELGAMYEDGEGVDADMKEAVRWYKVAAEKGSAGAMIALGFCYMDGEGVAVDRNIGYDWFMKAANKKDRLAMRYLGDYFAQADMGNDCAKAVSWYMKAVDAGDTASLRPAGAIAMKGDCPGLNEEEIATWMRLHAARKFPYACFFMGGFYIEGVGVEKNLDRGIDMLIKDHETGMYADDERNFSTNNLFTLYNSGELNLTQKARLLKWFEETARKDKDAEMMAVIANAYINKEQASGNDYRAGLDWAVNSAENGNPGGCFWVAFIYYKGLGDITQNDEKAFSWMLKAAKKGDKDAMKMVSTFYEYGTGTPVNNTAAAEWLKKYDETENKYKN